METTNNVLMDDFRRVPLSLAGAKGPDKLSLTTEQIEQGKICQYSLGGGGGMSHWGLCIIRVNKNA